ncbi:MAG TPA: M18 family aminopeptidase [Gammaproteobacteria bacterium]|nr:M18 family aminopeptidase [Gammaproteobacteria bacterium]
MAEPAASGPAQALLDFIDASPSPWHAAANVAGRLRDGGYRELDEREDWTRGSGSAFFAVRDGSSLAAVRVGEGDPVREGFRIIGAHTDSPGLRVKPGGARARGPIAAVDVEIYGGPILATFADRDLTLAGRVMVRDGDGQAARLLHLPDPVLRLPTLAIHMNRKVNEEGLRFDLQDQLPLLLSGLDGETAPEAAFRELVAGAVDVDPGAMLSFELAVADTQPGAFFGPSREFIADSQLDNLASCHAAAEALLQAPPGAGVQVVALFDHEEVGSQSFKGAEGTFLADVLQRVSESLGLSAGEYRRAIAASTLLSADMAHAFHPGYARYYDEHQRALVNGGPVLKINAKQRYATDAWTEATFARLCEAAGVTGQKYVHRNDLPCGSTIGPISAARLGVRCLDVGNPMWSMHSLRESAGTHDHAAMIRLMAAFLCMSAT